LDVRLRVALAEGEEEGADAAWAALLLEELESLDQVELSSVADGMPARSKGSLGALIARLPHGAVLKAMAAVEAFAVRTGRTVEASIEGDSIRITGASREQQDRVIEVWLARHPASP
jgi:hypothetical protein